MKQIFTILLLVAGIVCQAETLTGRALWIKDGDTFVLRIKNQVYDIRLWGIDTPEYNQPGGRRALYSLVRLIGRKRVKCEVVNRDRYKRPVCKVYYKGQYINLEQVKAGFAWWYPHYAPRAKDLEAAHKAAQEGRAGIWQQSGNIAPWKWRKAQKQKKGRHVTTISKQ